MNAVIVCFGALCYFEQATLFEKWFCLNLQGRVSVPSDVWDSVGIL